MRAFGQVAWLLPVLAASAPGLASPPDRAPRPHPGLRVALVQMDVADGDLEENMRRAEQWIREAAGKG